MNAIICLDDNGGMLFNERRQSRDEKVIEKTVELAKGKRIWITNFSEKLFEGNSVSVDDAMLNNAGKDDFCFVENLDVANYKNSISTFYVFKWNRVYPADTFFTVSLKKDYRLIYEEEFVGNSHEKITMEVWKHEK